MEKDIKIVLVSHAALIEKINQNAILSFGFDDLAKDLEDYHMSQMKEAYIAGVNYERSLRRAKEKNHPAVKMTFEDWYKSKQ